MSSNFGKGALPHVVDERDFQFQEVAFAAVPFDWSKGYDIEEELTRKLSIPGFSLPVKNQNGSSSCGGQAWSTYDAVFEAMGTGTHEERSAKFIYAQTGVPAGGSDGRTNSQLLKEQGVARETLLSSYDHGLPPSEAFMKRSQDITPAIRADAKLSRAKGYANVSSNIEEIAKAIRENYGVVIGIVGQDNGTWLSPFPKKPTMDNPRWYHWMYAGKAATVNGVKHIGCLNSWGKETGQAGWQWISEDYINTQLPGDPYGQAIFSVWTQVFDPNPVDAAFHYTFTQEMSFGSIGAEVMALQKALKIDGSFPAFVPPTGLFGLITQTAVKKFQTKYGIEAVGRVGPKTLAQLNKLFT